jgi:hypothetical protein
MKNNDTQVVLTKIDKLKASELQKAVAATASKLRDMEFNCPIIPCSSTKKIGMETLRAIVAKVCGIREDFVETTSAPLLGSSEAKPSVAIKCESPSNVPRELKSQGGRAKSTNPLTGSVPTANHVPPVSNLITNLNPEQSSVQVDGEGTDKPKKMSLKSKGTKIVRKSVVRRRKSSTIAFNKQTDETDSQKQ